MDFFNKARESFSTASREFTQKASDMSGIARINMKIKENEKNLQEAMRRLGEQFFEACPEEATRLFPESIHTIRTLQTAIENDKRELVGLKGMRLCPNCGAEQSQNIPCCSVCGINMDEAEDILKQQSTVFCPSCGQAAAAGTRFCMNCGTKLT